MAQIYQGRHAVPVGLRPRSRSEPVALHVSRVSLVYSVLASFLLVLASSECWQRTAALWCARGFDSVLLHGLTVPKCCLTLGLARYSILTTALALSTLIAGAYLGWLEGCVLAWRPYFFDIEIG
jgi:hypothetical protein